MTHVVANSSNNKTTPSLNRFLLQQISTFAKNAVKEQVLQLIRIDTFHHITSEISASDYLTGSFGFDFVPVTEEIWIVT